MTSENSTSPVGDEQQSIDSVGGADEHSVSLATEADSMDDGNTAQGYRQEVERALERDTNLLGKVFIAWREDPDVSSIASKVGKPKPHMYHYTRAIRALMDNEKVITSAPGAAKKVADTIRVLVKNNRDILSRETVTGLESLEDEYNRAANGEQAIVHHDKQIARENKRIVREHEQITRETKKQEETPGIYVYSYQHYIRYPVIPSHEDDIESRTYLKVGMSRTDADGRVRQQNVTAVPEPPIILRRYTHPDGDLKEIEGKIHRHLNAAGHNQNRQPGSGTEWFLTHLPFIDSRAELLGLSIEYKNEKYYSS